MCYVGRTLYGVRELKFKIHSRISRFKIVALCMECVN